MKLSQERLIEITYRAEAIRREPIIDNNPGEAIEELAMLVIELADELKSASTR